MRLCNETKVHPLNFSHNCIDSLHWNEWHFESGIKCSTESIIFCLYRLLIMSDNVSTCFTFFCLWLLIAVLISFVLIHFIATFFSTFLFFDMHYYLNVCIFLNCWKLQSLELYTLVELLVPLGCYLYSTRKVDNTG